jgi:hypothetical protein
MYLDKDKKKLIARFWAEQLDLKDKKENFYNELLKILPDDSDQITGKYTNFMSAEDRYIIDAKFNAGVILTPDCNPIKDCLTIPYLYFGEYIFYRHKGDKEWRKLQ